MNVYLQGQSANFGMTGSSYFMPTPHTQAVSLIRLSSYAFCKIFSTTFLQFISFTTGHFRYLHLCNLSLSQPVTFGIYIYAIYRFLYRSLPVFTFLMHFVRFPATSFTNYERQFSGCLGLYGVVTGTYLGFGFTIIRWYGISGCHIRPAV